MSRGSVRNRPLPLRFTLTPQNRKPSIVKLLRRASFSLRRSSIIPPPLLWRSSTPSFIPPSLLSLQLVFLFFDFLQDLGLNLIMMAIVVCIWVKAESPLKKEQKKQPFTFIQLVGY
ncbi:hypothetical protein L6452_03250 [Arctium lappa]|uniref:Uncharacterized protein n=1 Tax=Arctium lappa TaxID=4217 RepID=A0ACB9FMX7_ARCLA|nr:hypothetical protein L6452_03250 [Arctium lappa]